MPLYVVNPQSLETSHAFERSPIIALRVGDPNGHAAPRALVDAAEKVVPWDTNCATASDIPTGCDAVISCFPGDHLIQGNSTLIRCSLDTPASRILVPVHLNDDGCEARVLIGLQPRIWKHGDRSDSTLESLRFSGPVPCSTATRLLIRSSSEIWAKLYLALEVGEKNPRRGIEQLTKLWQKSAIIPPVFAALLVRNLIVLHIRIGQHDRAGKLLQSGMDRFPRYAELPFLAGWVALKQGKLKEATRYAKRAVENPDPQFIGSGGEGSYRSGWLFGLAAELQGDQPSALDGYWPGMTHEPAFRPSVEGILRQRLGRVAVKSMCMIGFPALVQREPQYAEAVIEYLLLHGETETAQRILAFPAVSDEVRAVCEPKLQAEIGARTPQPRSRNSKSGVTLAGPFWAHSSLARINRELARALGAAEDLQVAFEPFGFSDVPGTQLPHCEAIAAGLKRRLSRHDLTVRLHWPPDFSASTDGKLVSILPWEYSSIPRYWVKQVSAHVDELWAISEFNRDAFIRAGIPADRVAVIPPGIDPKTFTMEGPTWRPDGARSFTFLFVGGAIQRKGVDLLWTAYQSAFTAADDVSLVIKECGSDSFYKGQSLTDRIRAAASSKPGAPHLIVIKDEFDDEKLAALYRGANAFALPYRGEGFGMPLAESLACGTPVITTGAGPALEFCPPGASYFIPATLSDLDCSQSPMGPMSAPPKLFEPDVNELAKTMRCVFEHYSDATLNRGHASQQIRSTFSWERVTGLMLSRIRGLLEQSRSSVKPAPHACCAAPSSLQETTSVAEAQL